MAAASNGSEFFELDIDPVRESFSRPSNAEAVEEDEDELVWEAISRLPSQQRGNFAVMRKSPSEYARGGGAGQREEMIDVRRLDRANRELVVKKALATNAQDNHKLLSAIKERLDRVGIEVPKVEVRFENLNISAKVQIGSRALPTLINVARDMGEGLLTKLGLFRAKKFPLTILNKVSGTIKPGRMTLLLGPPGSGKSTLLLALAGKLDKTLKDDVSKYPFLRSLSCSLASYPRATGVCYMKDLVRLEKERNVRPSPEVDAFMKASSVGGKKHSVSTDYILKVLGLDVCSETVVGNDMLRGVSGGQRKRVTTGEMIVGPRKTLFMDEISTGLDSSTTFQIVKCIGNFVHLMEATVLMALLQPAPETFDLFDDLVLLSEGYVVYQGPRSEVLEFFESLGFRLPPRKGVADFLQEVTSKKDQAQYWADPSKPYTFMPVSEIAKAFKSSKYGKYVDSELSVPFDKSKSHPSALSKTKYAASRWELFKTCFEREVAFVGFVTCTMFLRTRLHPTDEANGSLYLSCLFFGLVHMMFNGFSELSLLIFRLPVFYKQRDNLFHPAWAWSFASFILRLPYSIVEAVVWSCVVYYTVGFAPGAGRFFRFMLLLFSIHQMALGLFRTMGSIARDLVIANTFGSAALLIIFLLGGFIIPRAMIKPWWIWGYWVSPLTYGQRGISVNEFGAERWMKVCSIGLQKQFFQLSVASYMSLRKAGTVASADATQENSDGNDARDREFELNQTSLHEGSKNKGMILPFQPLTMTFHNVNYFVDMPKEMSKQGITEKKLQLLSNVSGVFSPGVLTALVGSSGAGKTTLMDVLAGRKTGGYIEGDIKISGHPKEQRTFARISGYVEQNDIHSPQVTIEESLLFSSSLRLPKEVSKEQRQEFVEEVMRLVELDTLRQALVGLPGSSGLSTEQRKRLTIAVELVANPSIIFMDEPTSGLDARAAAIVMRTVRNTVDTGRTVVCTIHQPSIDIFEAFDELLLMKRGGRVIYGGKLGVHSQIMIDYFQGFSGVPPCPDGYNPATWMLEATTPIIEEKVGEDFAELYRKSNQYREVEASIINFSTPPAGSEPLKFASTYAQGAMSQFLICLWKQNLVYWRSPQYNGNVIKSVNIDTFDRDSTQALFVVLGALYASCMFLGVNNASTVQPIVSIERTVFYREKAAGMYSPLSYAVAQVTVILLKKYQLLLESVFDE
ncbi:unnamed protein product [Dovyalis caffra]|uniref:ABC transporter domain-containing protein n=1 Tax=Dovyalis caffra TaxID=77055 RepID=A0AAV1RC43_9ROSI|nr:unnamed protein product [Dovyalis caffra]